MTFDFEPSIVSFDTLRKNYERMSLSETRRPTREELEHQDEHRHARYERRHPHPSADM